MEFSVITNLHPKMDKTNSKDSLLSLNLHQVPDY